MQAHAREAVYWSGIGADIVDYVCQCTICTKHKASPPAQPMLPSDIRDGLWQEITADYLNNKGKQYLLICNLLSKYPFLYKESTKSAHSLSQCLQKLISQYGLPCLLYTDNNPPFASDELSQFLLGKSLEDLLLDSWKVSLQSQLTWSMSRTSCCLGSKPKRNTLRDTQCQRA